jgi:hypothetical protein
MEGPSKRVRTEPEYPPDSTREGIPLPPLPMSLYNMFTPPGPNGFTQSGNNGFPQPGEGEPLQPGEDEPVQPGEDEPLQPGEDNSLTEPESSEDERAGRRNMFN